MKLKTKKIKKIKKEKRICDRCLQTKNTTRFGYKHIDFKKKYLNSGLGIIHTKNYDLCAQCLKIVLEAIETNIN